MWTKMSGVPSPAAIPLTSSAQLRLAYVAKVQTAQRALEAELKNYNKAMNWTANQTQLTGGSFEYFESAVRNLNKKMQALKERRRLSITTTKR